MFWVFTFILRLFSSHLRQIKWQQLQIKYISSTEKASKKLVCQIHSILVDVSIIIILQISTYRRNWSIILHWSNVALRNRSCANVSLRKLFLTRTLFIKIPFRGKRHNALYVNEHNLIRIIHDEKSHRKCLFVQRGILRLST